MLFIETLAIASLKPGLCFQQSPAKNVGNDDLNPRLVNLKINYICYTGNFHN